MTLYDDFTPWYRLLDPPDDHLPEAEVFYQALAAAIEGPAHTLLELGAGAGNNAVHLKRHFECTLADIAPRMLDLSRELNPVRVVVRPARVSVEPP